MADFTKRYDYAIPLLVDPMENTAELAFGSWPERLYVIDGAGRIAWQGGQGPKDFDPEALATWLEAHPLPDVVPAPG